LRPRRSRGCEPHGRTPARPPHPRGGPPAHRGFLEMMAAEAGAATEHPARLRAGFERRIRTARRPPVLGLGGQARHAAGEWREPETRQRPLARSAAPPPLLRLLADEAFARTSLGRSCPAPASRADCPRYATHKRSTLRREIERASGRSDPPPPRSRIPLERAPLTAPARARPSWSRSPETQSRPQAPT
jgi:hypothetical protein